LAASFILTSQTAITNANNPMVTIILGVAISPVPSRGKDRNGHRRHGSKKASAIANQTYPKATLRGICPTQVAAGDRVKLCVFDFQTGLQLCAECATSIALAVLIPGGTVSGVSRFGILLIQAAVGRDDP
jgi:hypothetical protein